MAREHPSLTILRLVQKHDDLDRVTEEFLALHPGIDRAGFRNACRMALQALHRQPGVREIEITALI